MSAQSIFFEELIPMCENPANTVDISVLNKVNLLSPNKILLNYSAAEKNLNGAIETTIKNFAANFASKGTFSRKAIQAMGIVLRRKCGHDEYDAQKVLMLHISKAEADPRTIYPFFVKCAKMTIKREEDDLFEKCKLIALNVFKNRHVNEVIDACVREYGIEVEPSMNDKYDIVYVSYSSSKLRGFSGINTVYINQEHFMATRTFYSGKVDPHILNLLLEVDVINCVVHEYAHLKLRKYTNDFNTSSPILAKGNHLTEEHYEFGRYVEKKIFGEAIDWPESEEELTLDYLEKVISAIKDGTDIQRSNNLENITVRESCTTMALDYVNLKCYYKTNNPFLTIKPLKVEVHSYDPLIMQFYDFMPEKLMNHFINITSHCLKRALVTGELVKGKVPSKQRTACNDWMDYEKGDEVFKKVPQIIHEATGLDLMSEGAAEDSQISTYSAIGGFYAHHYDTLHESRYRSYQDLDDAAISRGDRITTLTDLVLGGGTAFPKIGVVAQPVKGSAVFWFNLKKNGQRHEHTLHGGCPVLLGEMGVFNKWILSGDQMFFRKCSLDLNQ